MSQEIDPRVSAHNFAMEMESVPAEIPPAEFQPMDAAPLPAMESSAPKDQGPNPNAGSYIPQAIPPSYGSRVTEPQETIQVRNPRHSIKEAFQLSKNGSGSAIAIGYLISSVNAITFEEVDDASRYAEQTGVGNPTEHLPEVFEDIDGVEAELDWRGNVYLYWETDEDGVVTACDIRGPEEPDHVPLPLDGSSEESGAGAKFYKLIGTVPAGDAPIEQHLRADFYWSAAFIKQPEGSSSSSESSSDSSESSQSSEDSSSADSSDNSSGDSSGDGSSGGGSSGGESSGSDKSTAIVPAPWSPTGYAALFTLEAPDVRFNDVMHDVAVTGQTTRVPIDPRYLAVIEVQTLRVLSVSGDQPYAVGATIERGDLVLHALKDARRRPCMVQVQLSAIRRGFLGKRFSLRTREQFLANEKFINSAYPK
jgi:hypothetical protein